MKQASKIRNAEHFLTIRYPITVRELTQEEGGGYLATIPMLGEKTFVADGATPAEALEALDELRQELIPELVAKGVELPVLETAADLAESYSGSLMLRVSRSLHGRLVASAKRNGISLNKFAAELLACGLGERTAIEDMLPQVRTMMLRVAESSEISPHSPNGALETSDQEDDTYARNTKAARSQVPFKIAQLSARLRQRRPTDHSISYRYSTWLAKFPQDQDLGDIYSRFPDSITRGNVITLAQEALVDTTKMRRLALAVMIWGYGTNARGPYRTSVMLSQSHAEEHLNHSARLVRAGALKDACLYLCNSGEGHLKQFGWSYFTKLFYFVGAASGQNPMPLILDGMDQTRGVAGGMRQLAQAGDADAAEAMNLWWSNRDVDAANGYVQYVQLVNKWAEALGCRPDAIEMELWSGLRE